MAPLLKGQTSLLALALIVAVGGDANGELVGDEFDSTEWRVRLSAPANWNATDKTAYPNILLRLYRRAPDGKMLLTAEAAQKNATSISYANATVELLDSIGFETRAPQLHPATGAYLIDSQSKSAFLRQAFLVKNGIAYSLTLSAKDSRLRSRHLRAFDKTLRSIEFMAGGSGSGSGSDGGSGSGSGSGSDGGSGSGSGVNSEDADLLDAP